MTILIGSFLLASIALQAQSPSPVAKAATYSLDQFGPVETPADAEATYEKACQQIITDGGGLLIIPAKTTSAWKLDGNPQGTVPFPPSPAAPIGWKLTNGVTVFDIRSPIPKILPPELAGLEIDRTVNLPPGESLPTVGLDFPLITMHNNVIHGSASYRDWVQEASLAGKDAKIYVATIRSIYPGLFVNLGGNIQLCVKSLGYDKEKKMWYFTADAPFMITRGAIINNKSHVNLLDLRTESRTENSSVDVRLWEQNYSQGDKYMFDARFQYMGDVHSSAADENGVIYAAFVESLTSVTHARVGKWTPATGELVVKGMGHGDHHGPSHDALGTGRPIINLNPAKWVTNGTVMIVRPAIWDNPSVALDNPVFHGQTYPTTIERNHRTDQMALKMGGLIRFSADAPVTDELVGRYFAVDEPGEYVPGAATLRRWYLIDSVTKNDDGTKDLRIIRYWWGAKSAGSPTLYKADNYSADGHEKPLPYVIAPGANVYEISDAFTHNGSRGVPPEGSTFSIKLVPTSFTGTAVDFAEEDEVEQAIGPDPFKPVPFRSWLTDKVPGIYPSSVFDISNKGIMRDSVLYVHGGDANAPSDKTSNWDQNPWWDKFLNFDATCNTGIRFGADTESAAILFAQPFHEQPLKWNYDITTNHAPKVASLSVSRDTGEFNFSGPISVTGLSAGGGTPARNLRGKDVAVKAGEMTVTIQFPNEEADASYAVFVEQSWLGNRAIAKKDAKGFTIQFEKPAPADAKLDWMIVR